MNASIKRCAVKDPVSVTVLYSFGKQKFSDGYFFNSESHDFTRRCAFSCGGKNHMR